MQRLFKRLVKYLQDIYYWSLDYIYVGYWQLYYLIVRKDITSFYHNQEISHSLQIIIIPGIYESWRFMGPIIRLLAQHGYRVHVIETLGYSHRSIEDMAASVDMYVQDNKLINSVIVAHSKGGLVGKFILANSNHANTTMGLVAIATPFSGSTYAYMTPAKSLRIFRPNSPILTSLQAQETVNKNIVSIYGQFDPHIPKGSYLKNAHNIQVTASGHFRILNDAEVHVALLEALKEFASKTN